MNNAIPSVVMLSLLVGGLAIGGPIAFVIGGVAVISTLLFLDSAFLFTVVSSSLSVMNAWVLVACVMFVLMAMVLEKAQIISELFQVAYLWAGPVRGGIAVAVVIAGTIFAACTGLTAAAVIGLGVIALPIMLQHRYDKNIALGSILAGGTLGQLIPPSVNMIIYGSVTDVSLGGLFAAGISAGLILSGLFIVYILVRSFLQKELCPALPPEARQRWSSKLSALKGVVLPILLIVTVLGSMFLGIATPTEASAVGAFGAIICAAVKRKLSWILIRDCSIVSLKLNGLIAWLLIAGSYFSTVFNALGGVALAKETLLFMPGGAISALMVMAGILFVLGMLLDPSAIMVIAGPIFCPIALALGFDPVWFGIVFIVIMQMGYLSPPFGFSLFYLNAVVEKPKISMGDIYRSSWEFLGLQGLGCAIIIAFPESAMWLPHLIMRG